MYGKNAIVVVSAASLIAGAGMLLAGPLNPPSGPVAGTFKTLTEVEPRIAVSAANTPGNNSTAFIITQPGSYYLTGNVIVQGIDAISIRSSNVVLDLNGFTVGDRQDPSSGGTRSGVSAIGGYSNITVKNGNVSGFTGGVDLPATGMVIENVRVGGTGGVGIHAGDDARIRDCTSSNNGADGFSVSNSTSVERCGADFNTGSGFIGLQSCTFVRCVAQANGQKGFDLLNNPRVTNCRASSNGGDGYTLGFVSRAVDCEADSNSGSGFNVVSESVLRGCTSTGNNTYGVFAGDSTQVEGCVTAQNATGAIRVGNGCTVSGNLCTGVPGFPVVLLSQHANRVQNNTLRGGTNSISGPASSNNLIVGNSCLSSSGTPINVVLANNQVGPIVSAGGTIASNSPWANFQR